MANAGAIQESDLSVANEQCFVLSVRLRIVHHARLKFKQMGPSGEPHLASDFCHRHGGEGVPPRPFVGAAKRFSSDHNFVKAVGAGREEIAETSQANVIGQADVEHLSKLHKLERHPGQAG